MAAAEAWIAAKLQVARSKNVPEGYKDPEGFWATLYTNYLVLGYNPKLVAAADMRKKWDDLLHLDGKATSSRSTETTP